MADEVQELRDAGRPFEALRRLTEQIEANADRGRALWCRHVLDERGCLLVEAAREQREVPAALADLERHVNAVQRLLDLPSGHRALLSARLAVIEVALRRDLSPGEIEESLARVVEQYTSVWEYQPLASTSKVLPPDVEPALVRRLPDDRSRQAFRRLAARFTWLHPGLLLAGETFAFLWQPGDHLPHDHTVHTWVLLADRSSVEGFPARLHVERDPRGCGVLYPHPSAGGYLWTRADFQVGLQHAWLAALRESIPACEHDFRWWLDLTDPEDEGLPRMARLEGRSAELALAAAIRAALGRDVLDQQVVSTASLQDPTAGDLRLTTVGSVALKAGGVLHRLKGVSEILVAGGQEVALEGRAGTGGDDPLQAVRERLEVGGGGLAIIPCLTFDEAYERLSHWTRITRHVNGQLAERADAELDKCDPYVRLPMSWRKDRADLSGEHGEDSTMLPAGEPGRAPGETQWERLSPDQLAEFCCGRLRLPSGDTRGADEAPRFVVLAESGMGKSTLLWDCLKAVAEGESQRVAVLVRDWSQIPWTDTDAALRELVRRCLPGCFDEKRDADPRQEIEDRCTWFRRLLHQGNVVLLLDAVDQTEEDFAFGPVAGFLAGDEVRRCVAIVTGRDHVLTTRSNLFEEQTWQVLRLEGFQTEGDAQKDLRGYLGNVADALLIEPVKMTWDYTDEDRRKKQWEDLLRVPLLARLLRRLANRGELEGLKNRESVYERAMTDLMEQGFRSLGRGRPHHDLLDVEEARETLQVLAWHSVAHDDFRGQVADRSWRALHRKFRDQPWEELEQVDIITIHTVLERPTGTRLSWRHLSFCEYFAGAHVAEMGADEQAAVARRHARNRQWRWVFRFALSRLEREGNRQGLDHLAACLVRYGSPFVLFEGIDQDKVEPEARLNRLSRWLVHRSWGESDYSKARTEGDPRPAADAATLEIVEDLFRREHRDSRCLHPAWELVQAALGEEGAAAADARGIAQRVSDRFLGEFPAMCGDPSARGYEAAQALLASFVRCPRETEEDGKPFLMGSPKGVGEDRERPQHAVVVQPFRMMRCQVTNLQYELFDPQHAVFRNQYSREDDQPVIYVSWYMAEMFCTWLGMGYRLPAEAEWEYACRAGSTTQYCFGDSETELGEYAWYLDNSDGTTHPVGEKRPNAWGLYDMHGNVWEWCRDWYGAYDAGAVTDPAGPEAGSYRVYRGGGWNYSARSCRSASRNFFWPRIEDSLLGFRVSQVPAEQEPDERSRAQPEA